MSSMKFETNSRYGHAAGEVELEVVEGATERQLEHRRLSRRENHPHHAKSTFGLAFYQLSALCFKNYILLVRNCESRVK